MRTSCKLIHRWTPKSPYQHFFLQSSFAHLLSTNIIAGWRKRKKKLWICQNLTWTVKIIKSSNFWLINTAFIYWRQESVQGLGKLISFACSRPIDIPIPFNFILVAKMVYALVNVDGSRWYQVCFILFFDFEIRIYFKIQENKHNTFV